MHSLPKIRSDGPETDRYMCVFSNCSISQMLTTKTIQILKLHHFNSIIGHSLICLLNWLYNYLLLMHWTLIRSSFLHIHIYWRSSSNIYIPANLEPSAVTTLFITKWSCEWHNGQTFALQLRSFHIQLIRTAVLTLSKKLKFTLLFSNFIFYTIR